jgi:hypothetical protein
MQLGLNKGEPMQVTAIFKSDKTDQELEITLEVPFNTPKSVIESMIYENLSKKRPAPLRVVSANFKSEDNLHEFDFTFDAPVHLKQADLRRMAYNMFSKAKLAPTKIVNNSKLVGVRILRDFEMVSLKMKMTKTEQSAKSLNEVQKLVDFKPAVPKSRRCLGSDCGVLFLSKGSENRMCDKCRQKISNG